MLYLAGLAFAWLAIADPKSCTNSQNCASSGTNCLDVNINGQQKEVCTKCEDTHVPIDGACKPAADNTNSCVTSDSGAGGVCASCQGSTYLYRGGCYVSCPQGTPNSETNTCDGVPAPDCNLPNCKSCPGGTCTECNDGFVLGDDKKCVAPIVNKSGLSTGAIAGIAVAAVIVVGGLVGFLCWWFICRGKA